MSKEPAPGIEKEELKRSKMKDLKNEINNYRKECQ